MTRLDPEIRMHSAPAHLIKHFLQNEPLTNKFDEELAQAFLHHISPARIVSFDPEEFEAKLDLRGARFEGKCIRLICEEDY